MTTNAKPIADGGAVSSLSSSVARRASIAAKLIITTALALTPLTAVLVLGWIVRLMRRETVIAFVCHAHACSRGQAIVRLGSIDPLQAYSRFPGWWSGLWQTIVSGLKAFLVLVMLTLPFGALLLLSWWAGWENSFNKGYEQAWAGPAIALIGVALAIAILSHLPMAFARFATEGTVWSAFDLRRVRRLIRAVRWRYLALTIVTVLAAAPLFLAQIAPTFMEKINPKVLTAGPDELRAIAGRWHLMATIYLLVVLFFLRRWAARLYARAVLSEPDAAGPFVRETISTIGLDASDVKATRRHWTGMVSTSILGCAAWGSFIVMLYIAQFANHAWWNWINHALIGLPWVFRPI
ncbi:MAG: DUF4013 domain-containing protein [Pseudomonadota bacterium]